MRILLIAGVALVAVLLEARPVQAYEGPWCAMMSMGNGAVYEDCQYASFGGLPPQCAGGQSRLLQSESAMGRRAERKAACAKPAPGPQQLTAESEAKGGGCIEGRLLAIGTALAADISVRPNI